MSDHDERLVFLIMHHIEAYQSDCDASEPVARELIDMIRAFDADPQGYPSPDGFDEWLDRLLKWRKERQASGMPL